MAADLLNYWIALVKNHRSLFLPVISAEILQITRGNQMQKNVNPYRIYLKATREWVKVSEEYYRDHTHYYDAFRKRHQSHGQCACPMSDGYTLRSGSGSPQPVLLKAHPNEIWTFRFLPHPLTVSSQLGI